MKFIRFFLVFPCLFAQSLLRADGSQTLPVETQQQETQPGVAEADCQSSLLTNADESMMNVEDGGSSSGTPPHLVTDVEMEECSTLPDIPCPVGDTSGQVIQNSTTRKEALKYIDTSFSPNLRCMGKDAQRIFRIGLEKLGVLLSHECLRRKAHSVVTAKDSPITTFGYPHFDERTGIVSLMPRASLSYINGFKIPIRVGAEDYYIQGSFEEVRLFLRCFSEYAVIGSTLQNDGKWSDESGDAGPIYIQVERVSSVSLQGGCSGILVRTALNRIINCAGPVTSAMSAAQSIFDSKLLAGPFSKVVSAATNAYGVCSSVNDLAQYVDVNPREAATLWDDLRSIEGLRNRIRYINEYIKRRRVFDSRLIWDTPTAIKDSRSKISVILTPYPRPSHGVRATHNLETNRTTLGDVLKAVDILFGLKFFHSDESKFWLDLDKKLDLHSEATSDE